MDRFISINQKRLNYLLLFISFLVYFKIFWFLYSYITFSLLSLPLEATTILDIIFLFIFFLTFIPCSFFIKSILLKFLSR